MRHLFVLILALLTGSRADSQSGKLPSFSDYPATETFSGKPAAPLFQTAGQRKFRTMIREGAAKGPNFAGRYTIAMGNLLDGAFSIRALTGMRHGMQVHSMHRLRRRSTDKRGRRAASRRQAASG